MELIKPCCFVGPKLVVIKVKIELLHLSDIKSIIIRVKVLFVWE